MNNKFKFILGLGAVAMIASCKPHLNTNPISANGLDFTRYVAVGNSLTAGYADGTLYRSGQLNSYPSILATQFSAVAGPITFKQPLLPGEYGYPGPKRVLGYSTDCKSVTSLAPVLYTGAVDTLGSSVNIASAGPYNNTGVPGIRAIDYLIPGYPALNPYSKRFFNNLAATPLAEINRLSPTFFTAWIGNNDVLGYATSGGAGKGSNGSFADQNSISSTALFSLAVDSVLNRMTANGAKGAVINIPDVTAIPYFTTVPTTLALDATTAAQLNSLYVGTGITFAAGTSNHFVIQDTSVAVVKRRQLRDGEYLILTIPQDSIKCAGWGTIKPIPMNYVLDAKEVTNVRIATTTFNQILQSKASARGLAYVDINSYLHTVASGFLFNGSTFNTVFVSGGVFSLDGVHLTPRGYAVVANEIIRSINVYYGSSIPSADINTYPGMHLP
jgi:hypothetical protein